MDQQRLRRAALWGAAIYALCAAADGLLTASGLGGDLSLEGNPVVRWSMGRLGVGWALVLHKSAIGLGCALIALRLAPAIHRGEAWIWRIPMLAPIRRWMRGGDRSWVALVPLYAMSAAQALAAALWLGAR